MSTARVLAGALTLGVTVAFVVFASSRFCRRRVPTLDRAAHATATAVLASAGVILPAQLLGATGWFRPIPLAVVIVTAGAAMWFAAGAPAAAPPRRDRHGLLRWATYVSWGVTGAVVGGWVWRATAPIRLGGITDYDSLHYHLPFATNFVRDGWTTRLMYVSFDPTQAFHPLSGELFQGLTIAAITTDMLVPLLNVVWFGVLLVAAWSIAAQWRTGALGMLAGAAIGAMPVLVLTQPGTANTDIGALAFLVAAVGLLLRAPDDGGVVAFAGIAAGLAVSFKLTALAGVAVLTLAVVVVHRRRLRCVAAWAGALAATGSYWYVRNIARTGNPLPNLDFFGLLPSPRFPIVDQFGPSSLLQYVTAPNVLQRSVRPALVILGDAPLVLVTVLCALALVAIVVGPARPRLLGVFAVALGLAYLATPMTAFGPRGRPYPWIVGSNLRYLAPALVVAALAGVASLSSRSPRSAVAVGGVLVAVSTLAGVGQGGLRDTLAPVVAGGLVVVAAVATAEHARRLSVTPVPVRAPVASTPARTQRMSAAARTRAPVAYAVVTAAVVVAVGAVAIAARTPGYVRDRYRGFQAPQYAAAAAIPRAGARIGVLGLELSYPLVGPHATNHVEWALVRTAHGGVRGAASCGQWRSLVNERRLDWLVLSTRGRDYPLGGLPEAVTWTAADPDAQLVLARDDIRVFRLRGPLSAATCPSPA